jgi:hypothetical protein
MHGETLRGALGNGQVFCKSALRGKDLPYSGRDIAVVRASDCQCRSIPAMQHSPTQWNLRKGDETVLNKAHKTSVPCGFKSALSMRGQYTVAHHTLSIKNIYIL